MGAALIQRKELSAVDRDTAFWVDASAAASLFTFARRRARRPDRLALRRARRQAAADGALGDASSITALGATQQSLMLRDMDFRRVEMLPMLGALVGRRRRRHAGRRWTRARGRSSPSRSPPSSATTLLVWIALALAAAVRVLDGRACATSAASAPTCSATGCSTTCRSNGDRFLIGRFLGTAALGIYAVAYNTIVQPASKARRAAAARVLARVLAHPGRARADRRHLGARQPASSPPSPCPRSPAWWSSRRTSCRSCSATSGTRPSRSSRSSRGSASCRRCRACTSTS